MSSQQQQMPTAGAPPSGGKPKHPPCPKCARPMTVKRIAPVLFASNLDDTIFGCEDCGTEIKRTVKRA
jgi:ribosomal protein L37AE/L43A